VDHDPEEAIDWAANAMRDMPYEDRNRLIRAGSPIVIDAREIFGTIPL